MKRNGNHVWLHFSHCVPIDFKLEWIKKKFIKRESQFGDFEPWFHTMKQDGMATAAVEKEQAWCEGAGPALF